MKYKLIHKLNKVGRYSYSVVIPKNIVKKFKWKERQNLDIEVDTVYETIKIRDWKKKKKK